MIHPRIGILLDQPDALHHFQSILRHLEPSDADVILMGPARSVASSPALAGRACVSARDLFVRREAYRTLVSTNYLGRAGHFFWANKSPYYIELLGVRNVRLMYSLAVGRWNYGAWNSIYDVVLGFGPHDVEELAHCRNTRVVPVGYARYDRFFDGSLDSKKILSEWGCDPAKKTVVWLPTYQSICSIDLHAARVKELEDRYNVIVKPHPATFTEEPERIRLIEKLGFKHLLRGLVDNLKLFKIADWILSDYSGTAFGALYTDRPLLLLDVPGAVDHPQVGPESPDILIRSTIAHVTHGDPKPLAAWLEDAELWERQKPERERWRARFFAPHFGNAAQKAAEAILSAHAEGAAQPPKSRHALFIV